jgi:hypothetical protein
LICKYKFWKTPSSTPVYKMAVVGVIQPKVSEYTKAQFSNRVNFFFLFLGSFLKAKVSIKQPQLCLPKLLQRVQSWNDVTQGDDAKHR